MGAIQSLRSAFRMDPADDVQPLARTAAATQIRIDSKDEVAQLRRKPQDWQARAWGYFDEVGEVKYGASKLGDIMSKLRMVPAVQDDPDEDPVPLDKADGITDTDRAMALDAVRRLNLGAGHSELYRGGGVKFTIAGECYLVGLAARDGREERWEMRSNEEITVDSAGTPMLAQGEGPGGRVPLTSEDFVGRLWIPHQRRAYLPDSPLRGVLNVCEELLILDRLARSVERSRNNAGLLLMPTELDDAGTTDATTEPDGEGETIEAKLMRSMLAPVADEGVPSAVVPHFLYGPKEALKEVRHIDLARALEEWHGERTERTLRRLAQGINLPAEEILGMSDVNHWTAWQIEESTFKAHVEPLAVLLLSGITSAYLRPYLRSLGMQNADRFVIWYDASKLVERPNRAEDAKDLYDRWAIGWPALRDATNFADGDAPTEEEIQRRIEIENSKRPQMGGAPPAGGDTRPEPDKGTPPPPTPEEEPAPPSGDNVVNVHAILAAAQQRRIAELERRPRAIAAGASRVEQVGTRLTQIDRQTRERILGALDASMRRTLERAGARLVTRVRNSKDSTLKQLIKDRPNIEVAAVLGPRLIQQLGEDEAKLLEGAFDDVSGNFDKWLAQAQAQALRAIPNLGADAAANAEHLQRADRAEAWGWAQNELRTAAAMRLYEPTPKPPAAGEFDATILVGPSVVRGAMARAGGAEREQGDGFSLGVASGLMVGRLLSEHGIHTAGWLWLYGDFPRTTPFEPHAELDGLEFARFDDPELANNEGFPAEAYFHPGDHDGCVCDWERQTREAR